MSKENATVKTTQNCFQKIQENQINLICLGVIAINVFNVGGAKIS